MDWSGNIGKPGGGIVTAVKDRSVLLAAGCGASSLVASISEAGQKDAFVNFLRFQIYIIRNCVVQNRSNAQKLAVVDDIVDGSDPLCGFSTSFPLRVKVRCNIAWRNIKCSS